MMVIIFFPQPLRLILMGNGSERQTAAVAEIRAFPDVLSMLPVANYR
jgi:hypothetical protein